MPFDQIVMARHATKQFQGRPVQPDQVESLQELIRHAATSVNLQPWRAVVVSDAATKEALSPAAYNQPQITSCSHLFVFCANIDLEPLTEQLERMSLDAGMTAEQVAAYIGMVNGTVQGLSGDARLAWAQRQTYLALANGINGAKSLGFDSCPMEGFDPAAFSEILGLPDTLVPTVLMPIGYASGESRPKIRFPRAEMFLSA